MSQVNCVKPNNGVEPQNAVQVQPIGTPSLGTVLSIQRGFLGVQSLLAH